MHLSNLLALTTTLLLPLSVSTTLTAARVQTHFYPYCTSEAGVTPPVDDDSSATVDVRAGTCAEVNTPSQDNDKVDYLSIDAELLVGQQQQPPFQSQSQSQSQRCNVTVHEVPGCVDPPLVVAPFHGRTARSGCQMRNFKAYSSVWVRLDCADGGAGAGSGSRTGAGAAGPTAAYQRSFVRRGDAVRRRNMN
ncbi:hypothetical protein VTN00DRAFT_9354 [Thermoascus crustaceus]|uniref:uncharacterized protein n=1 Tax=Thermoascus crustaceus TaxID=5088 RepID=UPI003742F5A6